MSELSKKVTREIMMRIVRKEFGEEQPFPHEVELCAEYNVSRVVIREAKKQLQALGMIQPRKKFGSFITPSLNWNYFNRDLFDICMEHGGQADRAMKDYFAFRQFVEPPLAAQVAENHTPEFEARLLALLQEMADSLHLPDRQQWLTADLNFHIEMYKESGNLLALPLANLMRPMFLRGFAAGRDVGDDNLDKHRDLAQAIIERDPEQALHYAHIIVRRGYRNYLRQAAQEKRRSEVESVSSSSHPLPGRV